MGNPSPDTESIWQAFAEPLRRFILKRVATPEDADDILQDVFMKIHARVGALKDVERVQGWVFQIARNAVIDYYRASRPTDELHEATVTLFDEVPDDVERAMAQSVRGFMAALPDGYREAVELEAAGVPQKDIAARLNLTLSGAKSRVQRGRAMLRDMLNACCEYQFDRYGKVIDYRRKRANADACEC